jgi:hypothetical protein
MLFCLGIARYWQFLLTLFLCDLSGSHLECQFSLMTFGIPNSNLPIDEGGKLKDGVMEEFVRKRISSEATYREAIGDRIDYPKKLDVLHGRGRPYQEYHGNAFLSTILSARRDEYNMASRFEKTVISYDIVKQIHDRGGRFIQRDEATGGWTVVPEAVAREKVSSGFRTRTRRQEEKALESQNESCDFEKNGQRRQKRPKTDVEVNTVANSWGGNNANFFFWGGSK